VTNQRAGSFWGPDRGYNIEHFVHLKKTNSSTNHLPLDIWYEASLRQGDSNLREMTPPQGDIGLYSKKLRKSSSYESLARIHFKPAWSIFGIKRFR